MEQIPPRSEEHTSELQSPCNLVCRLLLEKNKINRDKLRGPRSGWMAAQEPLAAGAASTAPGCAESRQGWCSCPTLRRCATFFFFNDTATTEIYTLSLHDALPI